LLVSTFDTSNVAVAHPQVLLKTTLRDQDQDQTGRDQDRDQDQGGQDQDQDHHGRDQDQDQDLKKVVFIGLETKTRSRDPHPCIMAANWAEFESVQTVRLIGPHKFRVPHSDRCFPVLDIIHASLSIQDHETRTKQNSKPSSMYILWKGIAKQKVTEKRRRVRTQGTFPYPICTP